MEPTAYSQIFCTSLLAEVRRRLFDESFARIRQCLNTLSEEQIWYQPNPVSNSIGNLVLHICGNTTQWIVSGLGSRPDSRNRSSEFESQSHTKGFLVNKLQTLEQEVCMVLDALSTEHLLQTYAVQAFKETGLSMLIHVVEHTSYHTGQITYLTKWLTEKETNYYGNLDLQEKNKGPV